MNHAKHLADIAITTALFGAACDFFVAWSLASANPANSEPQPAPIVISADASTANAFIACLNGRPIALSDGTVATCRVRAAR